MKNYLKYIVLFNVLQVTEDNTDDDVQCITPVPAAAPKLNPPPLVTRAGNTLPEICNDNIIQMTENDVTVNASTGGLKFRVDPQTLSSHKMYRLPDGRIFAINANPNMPGGYSATIVAVADSSSVKVPPKGPIYSAKLSAVTQTPPTPQTSSRRANRSSTSKRSTPKPTKTTRSTDTSSREYDLNVPIEWYRYNLIDAVDALEYSLSRLHKLKKEATSMFLRSRTVPEMKYLHKTLDRLLNTSATRFKEIRDNLNKELKQYLSKKMQEIVSEDDDDVEILNETENDDPIFIDENSVDSNIHDTNGHESQEVDLTLASSELNDSGENNIENLSKIDNDPLSNSDDKGNTESESKTLSEILNEKSGKDNEDECQCDETIDNFKESPSETSSDNNTKINDEIAINDSEDLDMQKLDKLKSEEITPDDDTGKEEANKEQTALTNNSNCEDMSVDVTEREEIKDEQNVDSRDEEMTEATLEDTEASSEIKKETNDEEKALLEEKTDDNNRDSEKLQDTEMSDEMIETLLKDDPGKDEVTV